MKKLLITALSLFAAFNLSAQITLEKSYVLTNGTNASERDLQVIKLELSGYKYALRDAAANQLRLYNLDHSLWKTINIQIPSGYTTWTHGYISERLFNLDAAVELMVDFNSMTMPNKTVVLSENGNVLLTIDNSDFDLDVPMIFNTGGNYKLTMRSGSDWNVYSLPGTIPCDKCGNGLGIGKIVNPSGPGNVDAPIPNPSNGEVRIGYSLPQGINQGEIIIYNTNGQKVKSLRVDNTFSYVTINNSEMINGTYYYVLTAEGQRSESRKMIVIP